MILFLGSALIDIIAYVDNDLLEKYRLKPDETVRASPEVEGVFQDVMKFNPIVQPGGSVVNSARLFQWISRKSLPVVITGCIGSDKYGALIRKTLSDEELHCDFFDAPGVPTGIVAVLLTDQNRTMVSHLGASKCFGMKHLNEHIWKHVEEADYFYHSVSILNYFNKNTNVYIIKGK